MALSSARSRRGFFVSFEGGEGAGKSTQIGRLAATLRGMGHEVLVTREPGGSPGAEAVRHVILSGAAESLGAGMEAVLFASARVDHIATAIMPALRAGTIVLCDRFIDSTRVYQGVTGGLDEGTLRAMERISIADTRPDLTLILDLDPAEGLRRADARRGDATADRFEKEDVEVHQRRRDGFLAIAGNEPDRCVVIDASGSADEVERAVTAAVQQRLRTPPADQAR